MEILFLLLGWLLGLLSPAITSRILDYYKMKALKQVVICELKDIKKRLVLLPFRVYSKYGQFDKKCFNWTKIQSNNFRELELSEDEQRNFEKQFVEFENEEKLDSFLKLCNETKKQDKPAFHFKKIFANLIDSNLMNFAILDDEFIKKILEIKFQTNVFNENVQSVYEYLKMTFDSNISDINHHIISKEIENKNLFIAENAIQIVEKINQVIF